MPAPSSGSGRGTGSGSGSGSGSSNTTANFSNMPHFTFDGWVQPVVNPSSFREEGMHSPEGQAFVVELYAAWRDWVESGSEGANGALNPKGKVAAVSAGVVGAMVGAFHVVSP